MTTNETSCCAHQCRFHITPFSDTNTMLDVIIGRRRRGHDPRGADEGKLALSENPLDPTRPPANFDLSTISPSCRRRSLKANAEELASVLTIPYLLIIKSRFAGDYLNRDFSSLGAGRLKCHISFIRPSPVSPANHPTPPVSPPKYKP